MDQAINFDKAKQLLLKPADGIWRFRWLALFVALPTLLAGAYLTLFASNQYVSETQFVVRGMQPDPVATGGLGQLLGVSGSLSGAQKEAQSIRQYLLSQDAVEALRARKIDLVQVYRREGSDPLFRLWFAQPRTETLLKYYRGKVEVYYDPDDGITRLSVRAFTAGDALAIANTLLKLGEERVNQFNTRAIDAAVSGARADLAEAETELSGIQARLTTFRDTSRDIDPLGNSEVALKQVAEQEAQLAQQNALLADMLNYLSPSSPQVVSVRSRVSALRQSIAEMRGKMTGSGAPGALTKRLALYEELKLQQQFATRRYEAARASMELAKEQGLKQRLFVVSVVNPNTPDRPVFPRPFETTLAILVGLLIAYGIGWMIIAGIREHRA